MPFGNPSHVKKSVVFPPAPMAQRDRPHKPKHNVGFPDSLWDDLSTQANRENTTRADIIREAARFRVNYAKASHRAKSADPMKVFEADPRLLDDLKRWCNDS